MTHSKMRRRMWIFTQFVALLVIPVTVTTAEKTTLVTPPGFEDMEGESVLNDAGARMPNGFRVQELHLTSEFASLGPGPFRITQIAFRPDVLVTQPRSVEWNLTALNLSTTTVDPGSLSTVFDNNYGSDEFTTVLSGNVQLMTDGAARPGGLPHDFDYVFDFQTPYVYDPEDGNLLVEFISTTDLAGARTLQDATAPSPVGNRFLGGLGADAEEAEVSLPLITIAEFTTEPEPPTLAGDFNADGVLDALDIDTLTAAVRGGNNPAEFDLNGDSFVDESDRRFWVDELKRTYFGDTNLDGEFNSDDLVAVFQADEYKDAFEDNSGWATGDWDGDGDFTSDDLILAFKDGGYGQGPRMAANAVPEPSSIAMLIIGLVGIAIRRRLVVH